MNCLHETYEIAKLYAKMREARENITYWKNQQNLRELHSAQVEAGARVLAWQSQLTSLQSKFAALKANLAPA